MTDITIFRSVLAGIISFISPCVMPLIAPYVALLVALVRIGPKDEASGKRTLLLSFAFILGFLAIFVVVSAAGSPGDLIQARGDYLRAAGSGLLAILGIYALGRAVIAVSSKDEGALPRVDRSAYPVALFIGMCIATGWTPCIGPTLGNIMITASTQGTALSGTLMLIAYALGLAVPFLLLAVITHALLSVVRKSPIGLAAARFLSGLCLVLVAYILATDSLRQLTKLFPDIISF